MEKTVDRPARKGRTAAQILAELREPILLGLSRVLRSAFASSVDELLEQLLNERSWDVRQKIDDSLDLLRNGREGIEAKFDQACTEEWASRTGQRERRADQLVTAQETRRSEPKLSMLSLVDDNQIGDQLTVGRVASRIRRRLDEEQVDGLRARFGLLLDRDWFSDNDFPIAPDVILECLRKSLSAFGPAPVVAYLLDQFEPKLGTELAALYADVNDLMIKRGVMPEIRYHVAKPGAGGGFHGDGGVGAMDDDGAAFDGGAEMAHGVDAAEFGAGPAGGGIGANPAVAGPGGLAAGGALGARPDPAVITAAARAAAAGAGQVDPAVVAAWQPGGGAPGRGPAGPPGSGMPGIGAPGMPAAGMVGMPAGARVGGGYPGAVAGMPGPPASLGPGQIGLGPSGPGGVGMPGGHRVAMMPGIGGAGPINGPGGPGHRGDPGGAAMQFFAADELAEFGYADGDGDGHDIGTEAFEASGVEGFGAGADGSLPGTMGAPGPVAPVMMPMPAVRTLVRQLRHHDTAAQGSAARYLSDPSRFGARHANLPATSQPLIAALTVLQEHQPPEGRNVIEQGQKVRENSVEVAEAHGTPLERLIIETVSLVFDNVYEDPAIADSIKQQLLRLQVAAFKAALIDPSFFARPEHPMRRLIDRIASMGSDPDFETGQGSPLVGDVAELVTWILASFDRDLAIIEEALQRLDIIVEAETDRRAERLAKIATAAARTERLERTRDEVRDELMAVVRRGTPEFVARFIADQWTEVISRLRNGADYAPFDEGRARRTVEKLVWSVAPKKAVDIRRLAADLPQLIADLSRGLSFVATSEAERELFFSELLAWHGAAIAEAKRLAGLREAARRAGSVVEAEPAYDDDEPIAEHRAEPGDGADPGDASHGRLADADGRGATGARGRDEGPGDAGPGAEEPSNEGRRSDGSEGEADVDADRGDDSDEGIDAVDALDLVNGSEIELHSVKGDIKRFKLGWMSPQRTVFIFSRYPKDHWTVRRPMLKQLLEQGRLRVTSRPAKTNQAIESLKSRQ